MKQEERERVGEKQGSYFKLRHLLSQVTLPYLKWGGANVNKGNTLDLKWR